MSTSILSFQLLQSTSNAAFMHPQDMQDLGLSEGQFVEVTSKHGRIALAARADADLRRQVISIAHGWGDLLDSPPHDDFAQAPGVNANRLTSASDSVDPINAMPCLTGLRVTVGAATTGNITSR